ncbi:MAG TPA: MerR family transcriptional regulator, partial [Bacteroidota bacterium]|nr:MerR family transcriptional regulator [Bacteroidota bacterium]
QLKPAKNRAGNRIYTNRDIKLILYIKKLLRDERYTIEGAKQVIAAYTPDSGTGEQLELIQENESAAASGEPARRTPDNRLRTDIIEIKKFLEELLVRMA